jgi:hypothetical protein
MFLAPPALGAQCHVGPFRGVAVLLVYTKIELDSSLNFGQNIDTMLFSDAINLNPLDYVSDGTDTVCSGELTLILLQGKWT